MKNLTITKNLMKLTTKVSASIFVFYIFILFFIRAANLTPMTTEDISSIFMFAIIVGALFMTDHSINIIYNACKKHNKKTNYKAM